MYTTSVVRSECVNGMGQFEPIRSATFWITIFTLLRFHAHIGHETASLLVAAISRLNFVVQVPFRGATNPYWSNQPPLSHNDVKARLFAFLHRANAPMV